MSEPVDEIERAAQQHREATLAEVARLDALKPTADDTARQKTAIADYMIETALVDTDGAQGSRWLLAAVLVSPIVILPYVPVALFWRQWLAVPAFLMSIVVFTIAAVYQRKAIWWLETRASVGRRKAVCAIGHGFDGPRYLETLTQKRRYQTAVVSLGFAKPFEAARAESTLDAIMTWMPKVPRPVWVGTQLRIDSGELKGYLSLSGKGTHFKAYNNASVHTFFSDVLAKVVAKLDPVNPVTLLSVDVTGNLEAWDAEPE